LIWRIFLCTPTLPRMSRRQKGEGFPGQRIVVLPRAVLAQARQQPLLRGLLPTDIGYFPRAKGHLRERTQGVDQAIFIHCVRGAGWCELAGTRHTIRTGELLVIPPGIPHAYGADHAHPWSIHWFHAQGALLGDFLRELKVTPQQPLLHLDANTPFLGLFEEVLDTVEHGYTTHQLIFAAQALAHLLAVLTREQSHATQRQPGATQRITQTITYMKEHLNQPLQLDALAALANLSRSRYVALFKEQAGYAPIDYFIRLRMHRACQLLDTTDASVKELAAQLGYEDPLYFSRVFRAVNDLTPTEYRKTRKG
jgi:AraC family transcriptional regulator of arabinose operon